MSLRFGEGGLKHSSLIDGDTGSVHAQWALASTDLAPSYWFVE
jgi:hypothetical protein